MSAKIQYAVQVLMNATKDLKAVISNDKGVAFDPANGPIMSQMIHDIQGRLMNTYDTIQKVCKNLDSAVGVLQADDVYVKTIMNSQYGLPSSTMTGSKADGKVTSEQDEVVPYTYSFTDRLHPTLSTKKYKIYSHTPEIGEYGVQILSFEHNGRAHYVLDGQHIFLCMSMLKTEYGEYMVVKDIDTMKLSLLVPCKLMTVEWPDSDEQ